MIIAIKNKHIFGKGLSFDNINNATKEILQKHGKENFVARFCERYGYKELPYFDGYCDYAIDLEERVVCATSKTFPKVIDGAKVLYHTEKRRFEPVYSSGGKIVSKVCYIAICKHNDVAFHIDENLKVVADGCLGGTEDCKRYMTEQGIVWHKCKDLESD